MDHAMRFIVIVKAEDETFPIGAANTFKSARDLSHKWWLAHESHYITRDIETYGATPVTITFFELDILTWYSKYAVIDPRMEWPEEPK